MAMLERLKRLYDSGKLTADGLKKAVKNNLITAADYAVITGEPYDED